MIIKPENVPSHTSSTYPQQFQHYVAGRVRKRVGNAAGLKNFGVNLVTLKPGSCSALRHWHTKQDEFIYVIEGSITLITDAGEQLLTPGMMVGFPAGEPNGHHLVNRSDSIVVYLEIGDRTPDDQVNYPDDDLMAKLSPHGWIYTRKDSTLSD